MNNYSTTLVDKNSLTVVVAQLLVCATLFFSYLSYPYYWLYIQQETLIYFACVFVLISTLWSFWSWYFLTKSLFDPYTLFLSAAVLFNGGQAILEIFHLNKEGLLYSRFSSDTLLATLFLVNLGLAFFHLGALLSALSVKTSILKSELESHSTLSNNLRSCYKVGWILFSIATLPAIVVARDAIQIAMYEGYSAFYQQERATSFGAIPQILADFLIPGIFFLLVGSKGRRKGSRRDKIICIAALLFHAFSRLFLGVRNSAVMPFVVFTWLWHRWVRPIPRLFFLSMALLALLVIFPITAATREMAGETRLSIDVLLDAFLSEDNPIIASISEMGGSMMTVAYTLELVPKIKGFEMGIGYFNGILTLVPNLFWSLHPAVAHGYPDTWLAWEVNPPYAAKGHTYGFSFIAEAYLNFGWIGAPIILGAIGFFLGKLTVWAIKSNNPARMAMVASFTSFFLFYARGAAVFMVRPLVWYSLIPYLAVYALNKHRLKKVMKY